MSLDEHPRGSNRFTKGPEGAQRTQMMYEQLGNQTFKIWRSADIKLSISQTTEGADEPLFCNGILVLSVARVQEAS